jgi:RNA polymerase sigma-70 factor (ECF subfamily)
LALIYVRMNGVEEHWVAQARAGDQSAFRRLVEAYARPLFALCARITRDPALADDAVQEALLNAWRHLGEFDGRASFKTWLHRIAVNAALEQLRRRGRHESAVETRDDEDDFLAEVADDMAGPDRHAQGSEIRRHTEIQLGHMSVIERTAFVMRHHEGHSLEDISTTLSLNTNACKQAIFRAVRKLRGALQPLR